MKPRIHFEESYFEAEERNGFLVTSMMKRTWAAQLEVLVDVDEVCRKYGIRYFANWGTLLGAVRHQGFIPWDDDIDIVMLRDDYQKFCRIALSELPEGYDIASVQRYANYENQIVRVINSGNVSIDEDRLERYHGCPYSVGLDIDILDYRSRNEDEDFVQLEMLKIVLHSVAAVAAYEAGSFTFDEMKEFLDQVEDLCNVKFNYEKSVYQQLRVLGEYISMLYKDEDADELQDIIYRIINRPHYHLPKEWYDEIVYVPFEGVIAMPIPKEYDNILTFQYGDNYMTPIHAGCGHDYPFYKRQQGYLSILLRENHMSGEPFEIDLNDFYEDGTRKDDKDVQE